MSMRANLAVFSLLVFSLIAASGSSSVTPHPAFASSFVDDAAQDLQGPASATEMLNDLNTKVMQYITQRNNSDVLTATGFLNDLGALANRTKQLHTDAALPDSEWDACLLQENATLHAWRECGDTLATLKTTRETECNEMKANAVGSFTINEYTGGAFTYKLAGYSNPTQTCDFKTFTIDGTSISCSAFVADIITQAKAEFGSDMAIHNTEKAECTESRTNVTKWTGDCDTARDNHDAKEVECEKKNTLLINAICNFQSKLETKCTKLELLTTELTALKTQETTRNKEFRTVMQLKCLFTRYTNDQKCFDTAADTECDKKVDGESKIYGSHAAQELHKLRTQRDTKHSIGGFKCEVNHIIFGDDVLYEKSNETFVIKNYESFNAYSYYTKSVAAQKYTTSEKGTLSPDRCNVER